MYQERSEDALTQANMSYSVERNASKSENDRLSAALAKEKTDREKSTTTVSSFS